VGAATILAIGADGRTIAEARSSSSGRFTLTLDSSERPRGLSVSAPLYERALRALEPETTSVAIELSPAGTVLRGLVRDFAGVPVVASVHLDGADLGATREDGSFEAPLELGVHVVEVTAPGFETQRRELSVGESGVIILNVDLRRTH
jgi:hypothetical protein